MISTKNHAFVGFALLSVALAAGATVACENVVSGVTPGDDGTSTGTGSNTATEVGSGILYGIEDEAGNSQSLVSLDPRTGAVTVIGPAPVLYQRFGSESSAYDPVLHRYTYLADDESTGERHLVTMDAQTGATVANVVVEHLVAGLRRDPSTGRLLCFFNDWDANQLQVDAVDPMTGVLTPLATVGGAMNGLISSAFDGAQSYLFFVYLGVVETVDTVAGTLTQKNLADPTEIWNLQPDPTLQRLVGVSNMPFRVVSFDPSNAGSTNVVSIPGIDHVLGAAETYDAATHRYFFIAGDNGSYGGSAWIEGNQIFTVNVETGQILGSSPTIQSDEGVYNLQFAP